MLEGLLSPSAEQLYCRLLRVGVIQINRTGEYPVDGVAVRELVEKHFASWAADDGRLTAAAPRLAIESALLALERRIMLTHEACVNALASMPALQEMYERSPASKAGDRRVSIVGAHDATRLAADLLEAAQAEVLAFQAIASAGHPLWATTGNGSAPSAQQSPAVEIIDRLRQRGVRMRCLFAKDYLDSPDARDIIQRYSCQGMEVRAIHELPATMTVIEAKAAVVVLEDGATALTFRHGAPTGLLQAAFELYWSRGIPLVADADSTGDLPSKTQMLILRLLAAGVKDESIARHLRVSLRTVRRNITTLCDKVGAPTRFALATIAAERGWIAGSTAAGPQAQRAVSPQGA